jgi:hypothetical protein
MGEKTRDTGDAQRGLCLIGETRRNAGDGETRVVWLVIQRRVTVYSSVSVGASGDVSDGNRDGNDGSHQQPEATVNSLLLSHVQT